MKKSFILLPGLLLLIASSSMAMSLGRHSGATLIGRPLDISVQAVLEAQDDVGSMCVDADVFYADNKLDKSRVRVTVEKSTSASPQALIRIRSSVLVDEPVVTLYLRVGCQLKTERRYVTLAELVSEAVPDKNTLLPVPSATPIRRAAVPPLNAAVSSDQAAIPENAKSANSVMRGRRGNATAGDVVPVPLVIEQAQTEQGQTAKAKPHRAPITTQDSKSAAPNNARLKLEPLDVVIERDPQLKASSELLSIPAANPQERAAAGALWRALSAQPQDILRDTEKLQALESSVSGLQAKNQKTLLSIDDLNAKLKQARAERYANALVYALAALLLAAIAGLAFFLRHRLFGHPGESGDKPWWRKNNTYENQQGAWHDSLPPNQLHELGAKRVASVSKSKLVNVNANFGPNLASGKSGAIRPEATPSFVDSAHFTPKHMSDFGSSMLHSTRAVKAEELFDVQQQADFFVSIGQYEQAIEVLRSHIAENLETSALVYLDLFNLYHQLQRPAEYDSLRVTFNERFNTQVPTFEMYTDKNLGLESYPLALSRIEALWPSPKVLEIIEESLFRRPGTETEAFNPEAYRELLLLYSVAKEIISPEPHAVLAAKKFDLPDGPADSADPRPMTFMPTGIQPLSARMDLNQQDGQNMPVDPLTISLVPPASRRLGLDIDLSELSALGENADSDSASNAQFFGTFDADASVALPQLDSASLTPVKGAAATDNLIDFDAFDLPQAASVKHQSPEV